MNFSVLKAAAYRYLSAQPATPDPHTDACVEECLKELLAADAFRSVHASYEAPLPFLAREPYAAFLSGARGYLLFACTLGAETDRHLHRLFVTDLSRAVIYDACANAYLECRAEEATKALAPKVSYLFCPGYQGSDVRDNRFLFEALKPERIGMSLADSGLMLPQKSLAGIVGLGTSPAMRCGGCARLATCTYRKEGKVCFRSEQN